MRLLARAARDAAPGRSKPHLSAGRSVTHQQVRSPIATLLGVLALGLAAAPGALGRGATRSPSPSPAPAPAPASSSTRALSRSLNAGMRAAGQYSGAYVVDQTTDQVLYTDNAATGRLPASVEKLYTTTTALARFGDNGRLTTTILGDGHQHGATFDGTLYLRGGGDPTFGSAGFDSASYGPGTGTTMQHLVSNLIHATGIRRLNGSLVADETYFDADRGTPATGNQPSIEVEGELSGLSFDRGWANATGTVYYRRPALEAGTQLAVALKAAGVALPRHLRITAGATPRAAVALAGAGSPRMATLVSLTNTPSDNYFAETLTKDLGARFGTGGTTAAGAAVIRAQVAQSFGIHPRLNDGSGLSRYDLTSPLQVVTLLGEMARDPVFTGSLAIVGETGTLVDENRNTYAQGRCRGKTGTLHDVSNVVGYCRARDGHTLAYAFMMNGIYPDYAHPIQDRMQIAVAQYDG